MGRSAPSCLKIITCATHSSVDSDPLQPSQTKSSTAKRGWSFRKQSPKHRVVNNSVTSELSPSLNNKELQESPSVNNFKANKSEKTSEAEVQCKDESPPLPIPVSSKLSDLIAATEDHNRYDVPDDKVYIPDVKLDLPGNKDHLAGDKDDLPVDKIGIPVDKIGIPDDKLDIPEDKFDIPEDKLDIPEDKLDIPEEKLDIPEDKLDIPDNKLDIPDDKLDIPDENKPDTVVCNEKKESDAIVIQAAARGFLVRRCIIKYKNAVKLQAAVRGHLVRKHAVGTLRCVQAIVKMQALVRARQAPSILGKQNDGTKPELNNPTIEKLLSNSFARQLMESTPKTKAVNIKCDPLRSDSAWKWLERWVSVSPAGIQHSYEPEVSVQTEEHDRENCAENQVENALEPAVPFETEEVPATGMQPDAESIVEHNSDPLPAPSDSVCQIERNSDNGEPELSSVSINEYSNAPEQAETEERKLVSFGSRKASNPAFIAAQSKFEELTSSTKSISSSNHESCADEAVNSATDIAIKTKEDDDTTDNSPPHNSRIQVKDSKSGSDHPGEIVSAVQQEQQSDIIDEKINEVEEKSTNSVFIEDLEEKMQEEEDSYLPTEESIDVCKSPSPQEASPIILESQGTPSSQVSPQSKPKKNKKRKSLSTSRRSPVKPSNDSSARSSFEKLPKEHSNNNNKMNDEPKSGSSLPSYMQATESAKAKVHASSGSPRSGADAQEKDILVKKRFSLPANGRHGSPQILRSKSQVTTKGIATQQSPQDKKWQR